MSRFSGAVQSIPKTNARTPCQKFGRCWEVVTPNSDPCLFVELNRKSWDGSTRLLCQPAQWDVAAGQRFWLASFRVFLQHFQEDQT